MLSILFGRKKRARIDEAYSAIMAQARQPAFYTALRVPDTFDGRFDLLVLHVIVVLYRLKRESVEVREDGRLLSERFFKDMDLTMREMGVGDLSVPKRINKMAEAYFGRLRAYDAALDAGSGTPDLLADAIARNVYSTGDEPAAAANLASYVRALSGDLARTDPATVLSGRITFPDPAAFAPEEAAP